VIAETPMTVHEHVTEAVGRLNAGGLAPRDAHRDAEALARAALGWSQAEFFAARHDEAPAGFLQRFPAMIARRIRREPVAYITGAREFWGLEFAVTPDVLIPRPESEMLVEQALAFLPAGAASDGPSRPLVVDVGTGSGCLAVSLATERADLRIAATDISASALAVARRNAAAHGVDGRIDFLLGSLLEPVADDPDLIVSNPPYVVAAAALAPEVGRYEPAVALFSGADGLDAIRGLLEQAGARLRTGGGLIFEFGFGHEEAVLDLLAQDRRLALERIVSDLQDIPRVAVATRR
jgi:release factor glutamine methyltransferase